MGARMFTAVLPPQTLVEGLGALLEPRRDADPSLRWTRPEGWHLTTAFLADVSEHARDRLEENLAEVAASTQPFEVGVGGGICFPDAARARLLALGVNAGARELGALSARCRAAASRAGAEPDGATFVGHLTLARHNRGINAVRWLDILDSFPGWRWHATEVCLVESVRMGRHYDVVGRYEFGGH